MARRRAVEPVEGQELILPRHLTTYTGTGASEFRTFHQERDKWLTEHGVNPGDFQAFITLKHRSEEAHGLPNSSALARARLRVSETDQ